MTSAAIGRAFLFAFFAFALAPAARAGQAAQVVIYPRQQEVEAGRSLPVVVEVVNLADKIAVITSTAALERKLLPGDRSHAPKLEVEAHRQDRLGVKVVIYVPEGSGERHLGRTPRGPAEDRGVELKAGESALMKVEIPAEAFEKGDCRIEAWLMNGTDVVGKSESTVIRCVASGK